MKFLFRIKQLKQYEIVENILASTPHKEEFWH